MSLVSPLVPAFQTLFTSSVSLLLFGTPVLGIPSSSPIAASSISEKLLSGTCQTSSSPYFVVFGGGGAPSYNEIALEKNILYFRRTLNTMGYDPNRASVFFANGNSGEATVRYLDPQGRQKFKVPQIPNVMGASSPDNLRRQMEQLVNRVKAGDRIFFYFTGHGGLNKQDVDNNTLLLWKDKTVTVQQFTQLLDQLPQDTTVVAMMAQCYSGSFANLIYERGDAKRPVASQRRCGFFATIKTQPSVGCTPAVNEADYRDYSSSFFAGLSGRSRVGKSVASADYNKDGVVSYAEAHAFAKVDEYTTDLPISTSEAWLRQGLADAEEEKILDQPIVQILPAARPEQRYVVEALARKFNLNLRDSFLTNIEKLKPSRYRAPENRAYLVRLQMELINISREEQIRKAGQVGSVSTLDRLLDCESTSWKTP